MSLSLLEIGLALVCGGMPGVAPNAAPQPVLVAQAESKPKPAEEKAAEEEAAPTPAEEKMVDEINELIGKKDLAGAIVKLREFVKLRPKNQNAALGLVILQRELAKTQAEENKPEEAAATTAAAAEAARTYLKNFPDVSEGIAGVIGKIFLDAAKGPAAMGDNKAAAALVKEAFAVGISDVQALEKDPAFAELLKEPEVQKLVAERIAELQAEAAEEAKVLFAEAKPFPFTFKLTTFDGKPVSLDQFKGQVTIVDFWGTWCPPCREEIPHFIDLKKKYEKEGLAIVGINIEDGEPAEVNATIKEAVAEMGINYPCVVGNEKLVDTVPDFQGFPTTLFIDRTGKVRAKVTGYHSYYGLEAIVQKLLAEKAP